MYNILKIINENRKPFIHNEINIFDRINFSSTEFSFMITDCGDFENHKEIKNFNFELNYIISIDGININIHHELFDVKYKHIKTEIRKYFDYIKQQFKNILETKDILDNCIRNKTSLNYKRFLTDSGFSSGVVGFRYNKNYDSSGFYISDCMRTLFLISEFNIRNVYYDINQKIELLESIYEDCIRGL